MPQKEQMNNDACELSEDQLAQMNVSEQGEPATSGAQTNQASQAAEISQTVQASHTASSAQKSAAKTTQRTRTYSQSAPAAVAVAQAPKKRGWIVALVFVILLFVASVIGMLSCTSMLGSRLDAALGTGGASADALYGDTIAVIHLSGDIAYDNSACSPEGLKALLDTAESNSHIKAIVLRVDSGGGTATAGEEMATYVKQCSLPIVVSSASMNASAAYEISSQADYIFTAKSTAIGSIGTAIEFADLSGLYEKLGINISSITSADSKDASYGNRALTEEEIAYYQRMINQINDTFIATVAEGRNMTVAEVTELATGLTFTGIDAVGNGLADKLGTLEDAVAKAAELAGIQSYETYELALSSGESTDMLSYLLGYSNSSSQSSNTSNIAVIAKELLHL